MCGVLRDPSRSRKMDGILGNDESQNDVKSKLSTMSFEDLQKLKAELGTKLFGEARFGGRRNVQKNFKRLNKNRPREASSKVKPEMLTTQPKKTKIRDPRFDRLCGEFDRHSFEKNYEFVNDIKAKEVEELRKMLRNETNPVKVNKIKYLLQRMKNQERERLTRVKEEAKRREERQEQISALKEGRKPYFKSKFERKVGRIVEKYEELKESGKLKKYIEKKQKKNNQKHKRYFEWEER